MLRKLVENGIAVEFFKYNKKYTISKNTKTGFYYITSLKRGLDDYPELFDYEVVDTFYWEDIEKFIEELL